MRIKKGNRILIVCIGFLFMLAFSNCKNKSKHNGFELQRFKVINSQLDSIIHGIKDSTHILKDGENVLILVLRIYDSNPEFCFTSAKAEDVSDDYIYSNNSRIIGYIDDKMIPIIVLSNEFKKYEFEFYFYKFIIPTNDKKYFDFIYFPNDQYTVDKNGKGFPPPLFDPYFYYYTYKGNKISPSNYGKY
nr:hypothetical protein [uncultured Bacteroides sp.]